MGLGEQYAWSSKQWHILFRKSDWAPERFGLLFWKLTPRSKITTHNEKKLLQKSIQGTSVCGLCTMRIPAIWDCLATTYFCRTSSFASPSSEYQESSNQNKKHCGVECKLGWFQPKQTSRRTQWCFWWYVHYIQMWAIHKIGEPLKSSNMIYICLFWNNPYIPVFN